MPLKPWREDWNPFEIVKTPPGPPRYKDDEAEEVPSMAPEHVRTVICVTHEKDDGGVLSGNAILEFPGVWWPRPGDRFFVSTPNRLLRVVGVQAQLEMYGFTAFVYVSDPEMERARTDRIAPRDSRITRLRPRTR